LEEEDDMRALVVFESMFGNTERIARAIGEGLAGEMEVDVVEVGSAAPVVPPDVELLVIGGPTQGFSMSRKGTRQGALKETTEPLVSRGIGIRDWLDGLSKGRPLSAAAFDTRFKKPRGITGSAARAAEKRLRKLGFDLVVEPESFFVGKTTGPLLDGELNRAREWGTKLARSRVPSHAADGS
jgi:flavodoxin-like protein